MHNLPQIVLELVSKTSAIRTKLFVLFSGQCQMHTQEYQLCQKLTFILLSYTLTEYDFHMHPFTVIVGWRFGRVDGFRPKGRGFDSRSSRQVGTVGKSFTYSCLWRFGVKFRHSVRAV